MFQNCQKVFHNVFALLLFSCCAQLSQAQTNQATLLSGDANAPVVRDLNWLNEQFLIKQRNRLDQITRKSFGQSLKTGKGNLTLLQRLVDENTIPASDTLELQAMGVILGDMFVDSHKNLSWQVYEDELGKSHAVCVDSSKHCLFPITMLSRRIEVGVKPDVEELFNKSITSIKPYLPKLPFAD